MKDPRMIFGFALLFVLAALAAIIGLGKVLKDSSYGLEIVLGSLATLAGQFAQWAFSRPAEKLDKTD
jgi:cytochrome c biogenesis protein CcdA